MTMQEPLPLPQEDPGPDPDQVPEDDPLAQPEIRHEAPGEKDGPKQQAQEMFASAFGPGRRGGIDEPTADGEPSEAGSDPSGRSGT